VCFSRDRNSQCDPRHRCPHDRSFVHADVRAKFRSIHYPRVDSNVRSHVGADVCPDVRSNLHPGVDSNVRSGY
jgi:hypothetical protein